MKKIKDGSLYLIITEEYGRGRSALEITESALAGGVDMIQMREKNKSKEELIRLGNSLASLCRKNRALFIVNDDPFLAGEVGADGVHLGQEDIKKYPISKARKIVGPDRIIGISTHSLEQFMDACKKDVDYIAFGPIFPTKTKDYFIGTEDVEKILRITRKPAFFIGGINLSNIGELLDRGAKNIALIRGITEADNIRSRTEDFKGRIGEKRE